MNAIPKILGQLQRSWRRALQWRIGTSMATTVSGAACVAVVFSHWGWPRLGLIVAFGASILILAALLKRFGYSWLGPLADSMAAARLAEQLAPEIGSSATSATDFQRRAELGDGKETIFSPELAEEHILQTAKQLQDINFQSRLDDQLRLTSRRLAGLAFASIVIAITVVASLPSARHRIVRSLTGSKDPIVSAVPLVGDIRITYRYPAYTKLAPRVVEGGDGTISALMGTEVEINAITEQSVRRAELKHLADGSSTWDVIPMEIGDNNMVSGKLSVLRGGQYRFAITDTDGEIFEDKKPHAIVAERDAYPEIYLDSPAQDIELRDDEIIPIRWRTKDDFGITSVSLVIDRGPSAEAERIALKKSTEDNRMKGTYNWALSSADLPADTDVQFYLEVIDNDSISGPKRSISTIRKLTVFSARRFHEGILERQAKLVDDLVAWLGQDLVQPVDTNKTGDRAILRAHTKIAKAIRLVDTSLATLIADLQGDKLSKPEFVIAMRNLREHTQQALNRREQDVKRLRRAIDKPNHWKLLRRGQRRAITQLENDIVYLDDLLAIQRIDELKNTAKDLLSAQRDLQKLLDTYRETKDPNLRKELDAQIKALRQKMLDLLAKMSQIKENLPGEYRNLEAATALQLDDQLNELEDLLKKGDLEAAAKELENLANMIENMVSSIDEAEEEFGGERYQEVREQLQTFAQDFRELEEQQKAVADEAENLLGAYKKKALKQVGQNLDRFVEKLQAKVAEAIENLETVADVPGAFHTIQQELRNTVRSLSDIGLLLEHREFSQARQISATAEQQAQNLQRLIKAWAQRYGKRVNPKLHAASDASDQGVADTKEIKRQLDSLFPDPSRVLSKRQQDKMDALRKKQQQLQQKAQQVGQQMNALAQQVPIFGQDAKNSLDSAQREMQQAQASMGGGELPGAVSHKRNAANQLGKLRQALEQAGQSKQGGLPLPLGGQSGGGQGSGYGEAQRQEDIEIPQSSPGEGGPDFRKELLEAAKQKAPERYKDAVRRYYEELIR